MRRFAFLLIAAIIALPLFAQNKNKDDKQKTGSITLLITSPYFNSSTVKFEPTATLFCGTDTIKDNGTHSFKRVPVGMAHILVEADGFIPVADSVYIKPGLNDQRFINVTDRVVDLQMVVVEGSVPALVIRNDTLRFTPDGMNFADDDAAREVLRRMPGVEISAGQIKIGGKEVMKTYVDGRTSLFGDNPLTAIDHIKATDVAHIYAYDEDENPEATNEAMKGKKQRVINIETKSKMLNSYDGVLFGGVGPTLGETLNGDKLRYTGGASFNFFSDKWLLELNAMQNNQNSASASPSRFFTTQSPASRYSENSLVDIALERKWQGKERGMNTKLKGGYSFSRIAPEAMNFTETSYLPSMSYTDRQYTSQSIATSQDNQHKAFIDFNSNTSKWGRIKASYNLTSTHSRANDRSEDIDITDGVKVEELMRNSNQTVTREHEASMSINNFIGKNFRYTLNSSYTNSNKDLDQDRFTSLSNSISELFISEGNDGGKFSARAELSYVKRKYKTNEEGEEELARSNTFGIEYNLTADNRRLSRLAEDLSTGNIDYVNTYSYRNQLTENAVALTYMGSNSTRHIYTNINLGAKNATLSDQRRDAKTVGYDKNFLMPDISINIMPTNLNGFNLYYRMQGILPDVYQIRREIDNSNPLYLSAGNPDLTYSKEHEVTLGYMLFKGGFAGSNLHFSLTGRYIDDYIISKTMYFSKPTYLADYGYEAPAGSSFSTYDNYGSYKSLEGYLRWAQPLSEIKSGYFIFLSNDYSISPYSYINMDEIRRNETRLQVNLNTDKVKNAHLELTWMLNYNQSKYKESPNTNKILSNSIEFEGNVNKILKYGFLKTKYVYNVNHYKTRGTRNTDNLLNLYAGVNLSHGIELSVTAYDLLNNDSGRKWSITDNYSRLSYRENFGRYVSFNLKWNLSKVKSNRNINGNSSTEVNGMTIVTYSGDD